MPTAKTQHTLPDTATIPNTLVELRTKTDELAEQIERLQLQLARGTREIPPAPTTLAGKLEAALRPGPLSLVSLAETVGETPTKVLAAMRTPKLRAASSNLGTESSPIWCWRAGDDGPTTELSTLVEAVLRVRPMTRAELIAATGARGDRITGVINKLQVRLHDSRSRVHNLGDARVARWFVGPVKRR